MPLATRPALVLSGAGSRGAYQAGAWWAIQESGFVPSMVVATSAGALNGAMIVLGTPPEEMCTWWKRLATRDLLRLRRDVWRWKTWTGLHDASRLRALLQDGLDLEAVRKAATPLVVTATNLETGREVLFDQGTLTIDHLMASCSLMPGLPPVLVGGVAHADGGHVNAFPLRHALERGATHVVALLHDPLLAHPEGPPGTFMHMLRRASDVAWHAQQAAALEALALRTHLAPEDPRHLEAFSLDAHAPDPPLSNLILRFDRKEAADLVKMGYEQTRKRLGRA